MTDIAVFGGMFVSALASATLLPGHSEALLAALLLAGHSPSLLILAASTGNVAGSVVNWLIGRGLSGLQEHRIPVVRRASLHRVANWYQRYGKWSLLLSW